MNRNLHQPRNDSSSRAAAYAAADVALEDGGDEPAVGAHLVTQRRGYEHHGIYVGNGLVIHYAGFAKSAHRGPVEEVPLEQFAAGHEVSVRPHPFPKYSSDETVGRARSRLGENRYRLLTNNCEHFCMWCLLGESRSEQVHVCLTHPRAGVQALACLLTAFVGRRIGLGHWAADAV
ncbi:lecithin retinol acyltransferase family protein [Paraburkholderia phosphatilytica]|uniref:lecithin retinol acyltransferase family protein n=1 Tax=Paraburkholderia phosphatilytica TaxID=2282883 RepID=UPI000E4D0D0E|nr:lecithin retinol acyltransferase family protein [Paraburkholderia phosphatilytica]